MGVLTIDFNHRPADTSCSLVDQSITVLEHSSLRRTVWPIACAKVIRDLAERMRNGLSADSEHFERNEADRRQLRAEHLFAASVFDNSQQRNSANPTIDGEPDEPSLSSLWPGADANDLFPGFDIPFWLGDDQYTDTYFNTWS